MRYTVLFCLLIVLGATAVNFPIDASWFANRWTAGDWDSTLDQFQANGGSIVWQRGAPFRPRSPTDINMLDPDYVWFVALEHGVEKTQTLAKQLGVTIVNWFTYQNDEDYDAKSMIRCAKYDVMMNTSRIYYRLIVPHDNYDANWDCSLRMGQKVDVIITEFAGTDPHDLLMTSARNHGMSVHLPMPQVPDNTEHWPAYFEFTRRVMDFYSAKYGNNPAYKGVYQTNEACLCDWYAQVAKANAIISAMVHARGKQFVISPYIDFNIDQVRRTVAQHKEGFKVMARSGADIIAVQEGRGCAKGSYWWTFQSNASVLDVDPVLDKIVHYLAPARKAGGSFSDMFVASNQQVFKAFDEAVTELKSENIKTELWLNVEAFEYLRDYPCLLVDKPGNGMAELLDRTTKSRIDWALTAAGAYPNKIISFAWDADYLCIPKNSGYTMSLADEIHQDWYRPIVSFVDRNTGAVRGFNLMSGGKPTSTLDVICASGKTVSGVKATSGDDAYGSKNGKHKLLQQVIVDDLRTLCPANDQHVCVIATDTVHGVRSYHEYCHELY